MKRAISYIRVSTAIRVSIARQGRSGLGLEAQQATIQRFCAAEGFEIVAERIEVETGKGADALDRRPELAAALAEAKRRKCPVWLRKGFGFAGDWTVREQNRRLAACFGLPEVNKA